jgi:hypothetical protein
MKIVIDIPHNIYEKIIDGTIETDGYFKANLRECFKSGTLLPKRHGDLIDRDIIEVLRIGNIKREYDKGFDAGVTCMVNRILEAPTIIEGSESK